MRHGVNLIKAVLALGLATFLTGANASEGSNTSKNALEYLKSMGVSVQAMNQNSALEGLNLKTALTDNGLVYFDEEKDIFFTRTKPLKRIGDQLDFVDRAFFDQYLSQLPNTIDVIAPNEKLVAYMFTDTSCSWCKKVHHNLDAYTKAGITLKFLPFPRKGLESPEAKQMAGIHESESPIDALQAAFDGKYVDSMPVNETVERQYKSGVGMGVSGTPSFVINGYMFEGYMTPEQLIKNFAE